MPPVVALELHPAAFSPNADGIKDQTDLTVSLDVGASLTVIVTGEDGGSVRTLASGMEAVQGTTPLAWDGLDDLSQPVADGDYTVTASADNGAIGTASATVAVDTRAPRVRWRAISPEPVRDNHPVTFRFTALDNAPTVDVHLGVGDDEGEIGEARGQVRPGDRSIDWAPRYGNGEPLLPGLYEARLTISDPAGNRARSAWKAFRDHRPVTSRVIHRLGGTGGKVALTFDDCNDGAAWRRILRILDERNAGASFFCLGPNVPRFRAQARRTAADGHTIGSHSMNHALETGLSYTEIVRQNREPQDIWWRVARVTPAPYFRPPYGGYDSEVIRAVGDIGYARTIMWDVDPRDWEMPGAAAIADRVVANSHAGSIVVMHTLDGTAAALPAMIARLRAKGLEPVTLDELFESTGMRQPEDAGPVLRDPFE